MREIKKIGIIGLGAVGVIYGQQLAGIYGQDNVFFVADEERIARYKTQGIICNGKACDFRYVDGEHSTETADLLIFTVKYTGLQEALKTVAGVIGPETILLSAINGIVSEEDIKQVYGDTNLLYCEVHGMDAVKAGNRYTYTNVGHLVFGREDNRIDETVLAVKDLFTPTDIQVHVPENIKHEMWSKLMFNVGINQVCAVYDVPYGGVKAPGTARDTFMGAMMEAQQMAALEGVELTQADIDHWVGILDGLESDSMPSLRQDVLAKRKTEVELFAGTICALSRKHGAATPINDRLYQAIKDLEQGYTFRKMRRQDRSLAPEDIQGLLETCEYGILSTIGENGYPYGVPYSYGTSEGKIYIHRTVGESHCIDNIRFNPKVCFTLVGDTKLLPEKFSTCFESVVIFGTAREVTDVEEKTMGLKSLITKYSKDFTVEGDAYIQRAIGKTAVIEITPEHITGKARK